jgi:hypothetical protein
MGYLWTILRSFWQHHESYTFPISYNKEIVFNSLPNECVPPGFGIVIAMSTLILIFLQNEITFGFVRHFE